MPKALALFILLNAGIPLGAEEPIVIQRARGPINIDGALDDPGWEGATRVETWFETNPGDNVPPKVRSVGYLTYDDRFLYAGFEFFDPDPSKIRAPLCDRDNVQSYTDYGGIILDTRNDGKTGILLLANPRGIQYDAVTDDTTGNEDSSLDLFWDSSAKITSNGWILEMRVPFSSLRYAKADPQTWGIMLYRNYPRQFRYQMFSNKLPRGGNCFVCRFNKLTGLAGLPSGNHFVLAPYFTASENGQPLSGLGSEFQNGPIRGHPGADIKWIPSVNHAVDATLKPDFSQVESDIAQIGTNERFALFFPEKRPFFLEGLELFSTPIQAVYTRTITSPDWGLRATGKFGATAYTGFVARDAGGGSVVLPGPNSSDSANQDFGSFVGIARVRRDLGKSYLSLLVTDREIQGSGFNRVFGPDFQWRPSGKDIVTGQYLMSWTQTPNKPTLTPQWDGRSLSGGGGTFSWNRSTPTLDFFTFYTDVGHGFRADDGFVPQVGYRETFGDTGYTFHPKGLVSRVRPFADVDRTVENGVGLLDRAISLGVEMDGRWSSSARFRYAFEHVRAGSQILPESQLKYYLQVSPSRMFSQLRLQGFVGQDVDFVNVRTGRGAKVSLMATFSPTDHLELRLNADRRWLSVDLPGQRRAPLFTAEVSRLRITYTFTSRLFVRAIAQYVDTTSDPSLYLTQVPDRRAGSFSTSFLFSYKVNWQTLLFVGYGDDRTLTNTDLLRADRQAFVKLSYAFQR
jgi:hypothetical protein